MTKVYFLTMNVLQVTTCNLINFAISFSIVTFGYIDVSKIDFMNANKLQQDHPCVIEIIRRFFLNEPPPANVPLILDNPGDMDPSAGQVTAIIKHLKQHKVKYSIYFF